MPYTIICPYCFQTMRDDQVHFRSERVSDAMRDPLPDEYYGDIERFMEEYPELTNEDRREKALLIIKYRSWDFFKEGPDSVYEEWWDAHGGSTEKDPTALKLGVYANRRRVINPNKTEHQEYLKKQADGSFFVRDEGGKGIVFAIDLRTGERCTSRVCCHCHNPLPNNYGKHEPKFAAIIGITGAGKTVYLSQLLREMGRKYAPKVGLTANTGNSSVRAFLNDNTVRAKYLLPGSTQASQLQQPLFYELEHSMGGGQKVVDTFVLYDVAGEVFDDPQLVTRFAPYIRHADGLILLIDPMQFANIAAATDEGKELGVTTHALETIHSIVVGEHSDELCKKPLAVCISKADTAEVQNVLPYEVSTHLLEDVEGVRVGNSLLFSTQFNAVQYNPIAKGLDEWIANNELNLLQTLSTEYASFSYFAFTALGCDVVEGLVDGTKGQYPIGPVIPKRIEEPLLWLFHKLGFIGANDMIYPAGNPVTCPNCRSRFTYALPSDTYDKERVITRGGRLSLTKHNVLKTHQCHDCGHRWNINASEDS